VLSPRGALLPKRIFIVDDCNLIRKSVRSQLEYSLQNIICVEATNGVDAMQRINEVRPDIVLLDLCMPELNGLETAAALHDVLPKLPIILYTLHKDVVSAKQVEAFGICAVVSKTDQIEVLVDVILKHVDVVRAAHA
jgi:DNA-binding NarL/FixJ family response regulator